LDHAPVRRVRTAELVCLPLQRLAFFRPCVCAPKVGLDSCVNYLRPIYQSGVTGRTGLYVQHPAATESNCANVSASTTVPSRSSAVSCATVEMSRSSTVTSRTARRGPTTEPGASAQRTSDVVRVYKNVSVRAVTVVQLASTDCAWVQTLRRLSVSPRVATFRFSWLAAQRTAKAESPSTMTSTRHGFRYVRPDGQRPTRMSSVVNLASYPVQSKQMLLLTTELLTRPIQPSVTSLALAPRTSWHHVRTVLGQTSTVRPDHTLVSSVLLTVDGAPGPNGQTVQCPAPLVSTSGLESATPRRHFTEARTATDLATRLDRVPSRRVQSMLHGQTGKPGQRVVCHVEVAVRLGQGFVTLVCTADAPV
jgi:hypothetical protein